MAATFSIDFYFVMTFYITFLQPPHIPMPMHSKPPKSAHNNTHLSQQFQSQESYRRQAGAPVLVMVFYEALCPDSKHFILKQLIPTYQQADALMVKYYLLKT